MSKVHIREMKPEDVEKVVSLYEASWRRTYGSLLSREILETQIAKRFSTQKQSAEVQDEDIITIVAVEDDKIMGAVSAHMDERNQAWLDRLHLVPGEFGSGLADNLLRATLTKHTGLQSIMIKILKGNDRAIAFYEKHGFDITEDVATDKELGGVPTVIMTRTIARS